MAAVPVIRVGDVPAGTVRHVRAGGHDLVAIHAGGAIHVLDNRCPHAGATLHQGTLSGCVLTCPWHGSSFDVATGAVVRPPATSPVRTYPARIEGDWVVIDE
jgi:nitrite reductase/ring-hydroxylating ferredoxin subunit